MNRITRVTLAVLAAVVIGAGSAAQAQDIVFTEGSGDIFFLYESQNGPDGTWHTVFRAKGTTGEPTNTGATGLTTPFAGFPGTAAGAVVIPAQAGDTGDYTFSTLTTVLDTPHVLNHGGVDFFLSRAGGNNPSPLTPATPATTDLGIRYRLREDEVALGIGSETAANQFDSFTLTLNLASSTFNGTPLNTVGSPHVALLNWDTFNNPVDMINTNANELTADFGGNWGHVHRNWGFSEYGDYSLSFNFEGVGGKYGDDAPVGSVQMGFQVIPEPSTALLAIVGIAVGGLVRRRRRKDVA